MIPVNVKLRALIDLAHLYMVCNNMPRRIALNLAVIDLQGVED